ncbi:MAG: hypothetical protein ACTSX8_04620 [Alphaproteobacteria bacterium]
MTKQTETEPIQPEEITSAALTPVPASPLSRLTSREMMTIAVQEPRDIVKVHEQIIKTLKIFPRFAEEAWYVKPVGRDRKTKQMTYAEGLSIRAAEELAQAWGNCAFSFEILDDTEEYTDCAALFIDYERRLHFRLPVRVSKFYTNYQGQKVKHKADRFADLVMGSARSRGLREVILRCLPASLKMAYTDAIHEALSKSLDPDSLKKIVAAFESIGAGRPQVETLIGKKIADFDQDDRNRLAGIYAAIRNGESTVEEVFGEHPPADSKPSGAPKADAAKEKAKEQDAEADAPEQQAEKPTAKEQSATALPDDDPRTITHNLLWCIAANAKPRTTYTDELKWLNKTKLGMMPSTPVTDYDEDVAEKAVVALKAVCKDRHYDPAPWLPGGPEFKPLVSGE